MINRHGASSLDLSNEGRGAAPAIPTRAHVVTPNPESPLFTRGGFLSESLQKLLLSLPAPDPKNADELALITYAKIVSGILVRKELDTYLQEAVFKKNAGKFSYQLAGVAPSPEQTQLLSHLGFCGEVTVEQGTEFDTAIVWGGTLAAVESRVNTLLRQGVSFSQVVLLGTDTRVLDNGEKTHASETADAMENFVARANQQTGRNWVPESYPKTESEMIAFVWEGLKPTSLESLPVVTIDTPGRAPEHLLAMYKNVPGTADTFGYLLLFAQANGINLGTRFIAASSQPHVLRQTVDAEYKLLSVDYPFDLLCGVGRANSTASLTLYLQELAKLVNTQQRIATMDVLHAQHPDILNAVPVLTVGSDKPGIAFRQSEAFELKKPSGSSLGGKAGDYILVFKVPEGVIVDAQLIESLVKDGIPSKDYWISIIDSTVFHSSYSLSPLSEKVIGTEGLAYGTICNVYKAAGLKQKAYIPNQYQGEVCSLESALTGTNQTVDADELVLIDIEGNPYPKWASQFLTQFKPDLEDPRSVGFFERVRTRFAEYV